MFQRISLVVTFLVSTTILAQDVPVLKEMGDAPSEIKKQPSLDEKIKKFMEYRNLATKKAKMIKDNPSDEAILESELWTELDFLIGDLKERHFKPEKCVTTRNKVSFSANAKSRRLEDFDEAGRVALALVDAVCGEGK